MNNWTNQGPLSHPTGGGHTSESWSPCLFSTTRDTWDLTPELTLGYAKRALGACRQFSFGCYQPDFQTLIKRLATLPLATGHGTPTRDAWLGCLPAPSNLADPRLSISAHSVCNKWRPTTRGGVVGCGDRRPVGR